MQGGSLAILLCSIKHNKKHMYIITKQVDYIENWHTAHGVDMHGRHIFGAGRTPGEAIINALKS
mgnify:CR=1 FL=1